MVLSCTDKNVPQRSSWPALHSLINCNRFNKASELAYAQTTLALMFWNGTLIVHSAMVGCFSGAAIAERQPSPLHPSRLTFCPPPHMTLRVTLSRRAGEFIWGTHLFTLFTLLSPHFVYHCHSELVWLLLPKSLISCKMSGFPQNPVEILRLSWIIRGAGGVTSDPHLTGSALLHPTENPQTQHDKMGRSLPSPEFLNSLRSLRNSTLSHTAYSLTRLVPRRFELAQSRR